MINFKSVFQKKKLSMKGEVQLEAAGVENHSDSDPLLQNQPESSSSSSSAPSAPICGEINSEDVENASAPSCRICLESDCEAGDYEKNFHFFSLFWSFYFCLRILAVFELVNLFDSY